MRSLRFRFTMRRMMFLIAALAVLFSGVSIARRAQTYRDLAYEHELMAWSHEDAEKLIWEYEDGQRTGEPKESDSPDLSCDDLFRFHQVRAEYHNQLEQKYRLAALRPWLPVEPDPPPSR